MRNFVAPHIESLPESEIKKFFAIVATMDNIISLSVGEPDFVTPKQIVQAGQASLQRGETAYTEMAGLLALRKAICAKWSALYGVDYDPLEEALITIGASEALCLALSSTISPGDEVLIPEPCWVAYGGQVLLAHGTPKYISTSASNEFRLVAEDLEAAITERTKVLVMGYPGNPTGAVMSRAAYEAVAKVVEKHDLCVVSDEIYDRLVYDGEHVSFASIPGMRDRTVTISGFSKDYAMTGWRIGYALGPRKVMAALHQVHAYSIMTAPTTGQFAALTAMETGEEDIERMRQSYDKRRRLIVDGLNGIGLPTFEPRGAFYAFADVSATGLDGYEFSKKLLEEERVAVVPGGAFGPSGSNFVRCAYPTAYDQIEIALERMAAFVGRRR